MIDARIGVCLGLGQIAEIGGIGIVRDAHGRLADLEARQRDVRVEGDAVAIRHIDLLVGAGNGVLHHHGQVLGVEGISLELEFGREAALIADDGVEASVRHGLRLGVELLAHIVVGGVAIHELHGLGGIEIGRLPAKPHIEIDGVIVGLEVELLDVVDEGADGDLNRAVGWPVCGRGAGAFSAPGALRAAPAKITSRSARGAANRRASECIKAPAAPRG